MQYVSKIKEAHKSQNYLESWKQTHILAILIQHQSGWNEKEFSSQILHFINILYDMYRLSILAGSVLVLAEYTFCAEFCLEEKSGGHWRTLTLRAESWHWTTRELNCAARGYECNVIVLKSIAKHIKSCFYTSWILDVECFHDRKQV